MSPSPQGHLKVARSGDTVYVRACGYCSASVCPAFRSYAEEMMKDGYRQFALDLTECEGMDSTFMGVLLGIHMYLVGVQGGAVTVANASPHCIRLLEVIGLARILEVTDEPIEFPEFELATLRQEDVDPTEKAFLIRQAHEHLVDVDRRNEERFGALLAALRRELDA